ncbi:phage portal protein [Limosilactobacillus sp. WF-MT5-A]|uniref:phage portal protein n=1 Tax=Limosilactobacillus agrestis TaxID=2759748 RepID=UPI0015FD7AED|nr:phage portal protein [Limosilactobacillus agrestis]MBB1099887.1 phage portal protein [Limosilactobacillus agrestis]MCD7120801.1 phage portal protein [Limosilactobacillus agrestis]MCD7126081.1 phage portal protein [Limosilactobacillus agrestis]
MPIFKMPKTSPGLAINSEEDIMNFLNSQDSSKYVNARAALKNSDIYSLIYQLSGDLANAQLIAESSRTQGILNHPTLTSNSHAFWQSMYAQLLLGGEAFAYRWRNANGVDNQWEYLRPSQVTPFLLEDGSGLIYNVTFDEPNIGYVQAIPQSNIIHIRLLSTNGGKTGISPLASLADELAIRDSSNRLTLSALARSIMAPGILSITKSGLLNAKMKAKRSKEFMRQMNDSDNGPIVLDDLEKYTPLEIQGNVAQLLNQASWTGAQIAKVYGVSDSVINGQGDQQSSIDMMNSNYLQSLSRFANAIVGELSDKLAGNIEMDLHSVVDPTGDNYIKNISQLQKNGTLGANQATWLLQQKGYLPNNLPEREQAVEIDSKGSMRGGEDDDEDSN